MASGDSMDKFYVPNAFIIVFHLATVSINNTVYSSLDNGTHSMKAATRLVKPTDFTCRQARSADREVLHVVHVGSVPLGRER